MNLFLSLYITDDRWKLSLPQPFGQDVNSFDLDNYSDELVTNTAIQAIQQAERIVIFIDALSHDCNLGSILKVLNALTRSKDPKLFVLNGSHVVLDKLLNRFRDSSIYKNQSSEAVHEIALNFFKDKGLS